MAHENESEGRIVDGVETVVLAAEAATNVKAPIPEEHVVEKPFEQNAFDWLNEEVPGGMRRMLFGDAGRQIHPLADFMGRPLGLEDAWALYRLDGDLVDKAGATATGQFQPLKGLVLLNPSHENFSQWHGPINGSFLTEEDLQFIGARWGENAPCDTWVGQLKWLGNFLVLRNSSEEEGITHTVMAFQGHPYFFDRKTRQVYHDRESMLGQARSTLAARLGKESGYLMPPLCREHAEALAAYLNAGVQKRQEGWETRQREKEENRKFLDGLIPTRSQPQRNWVSEGIEKSKTERPKKERGYRHPSKRDQRREG